MERLLLVEDDYLLAFPLEALLTEAGYAVETTHRGDEAIKVLHRGNALFGALITDIRLGDGPDGWQVARRARELQASIPVIYMTADSAALWEANGVPESHMLRKPFGLDELTRMVHKAIHNALKSSVHRRLMLDA